MGDITMDIKNMDLYYLDPGTGEYKKLNRIDISNEEVELKLEEDDKEIKNNTEEADDKIDIRDVVELLQRVASLTDLDISLIATICAYEYDTLTLDYDELTVADIDDCICPSDMFCDFVAYSKDPFVAAVIETLVNESSRGDNLYFERELHSWRNASRNTLMELDMMHIFPNILKSVERYKWDILCLDSTPPLDKVLERKAQCDANEKIKDLKEKHNKIKEETLNDSRKKVK